MIPTLVRVPNPPYDLEEPIHTDSLPPTETPGLVRWLKAEAARVGQTDPDPSATLSRLRHWSARLTGSDLQNLKRLIMSRSINADERFLAVYMLGLAGGPALDVLREVSFSRIPGLPSDRQHSDEVILRAQALEALVQKLPLAEAQALLRELLSRTSDPIIARHAQYWLNRLS